ncbi:hypothetical protein SCB49_11704 [unidentified eubacterium SCB49]|nr:hypothetical protein SCB49_11704 [unidentified eubacterium SCB49]
MKQTININADLGEGTGNDAALMPMLASCSIACGGHYGDEDTMRTSVQLAKKYGVKVGAHPSFPDLENFGRKKLTMTKKELQKSVYEQIMKLVVICNQEGVELHHVKPHGALYNCAAIDAPTADAIVEAILETKLRPKLYTQHDSVLYQKSKNLLPIVPEAFIDRGYTSDLKLKPRSEAGALITSPEMAWEQLRGFILDQKVNTTEGFKTIMAETYCIHSDHKGSIAMLTFVKKKLSEYNLQIG